MQTAILKINRMTSGAAMRSVRSALSVIRGVAGVKISLEEGETIVSYDPQKVLPRQFQTAVRVVGCEIESLTVEASSPLPSAGRSASEDNGIGRLI